MSRLRPLGAGDAAALASFHCERYRRPWTLAVQGTIRDELPVVLARGEAEGLGLWDGDDLVGVVVWTVDQNDPTVWRSNVLAVRLGRQRRGDGLRLKNALMEVAEARGARVVISIVDWRNDPMIEMNRSKFQADVVPDPDGPYRSNVICTVRVDHWRAMRDA